VVGALLIILGATALQPVAVKVPLETIHADPGGYEGQIVETCGDAYRD
jgi:hypothetical protein